jgi:6-phosphogluconolactonase
VKLRSAPPREGRGPAIAIVDDAEALAAAGARRIRRAAETAINERGAFHLALAGGSTPKGVYQRLALEAPALDWAQIQLYFGDERCVPPEHPGSNYRMVKTALIDAVAVPAANVHRMRGEDPPAAAAAAYEHELGPARPLDLVLLGLGADGHTASLFPGTAALDETERACVAVDVPALRATRLTLTYPVLLEARAVLFLIAGVEKAHTLREVVEGEMRPAALPAQRIVRGGGGPVTILCDRAAASELPTSY